MKKQIVGCVALLMLAGCGPSNTPQPFTDWSYRTRDKEHNRYDGYAPYSIKAEQWQTDPYWTMGEGKARRDAAKAKALTDAIKAREAEAVHLKPAVQHAPSR